MLVKVVAVDGVGGVSGWNGAELGKLALVYGRNGAGKSTMARVFRAAAAGDAAAILGERTLAADGPPRVTLATDAGPVVFDGTRWSGAIPKVRVFDRAFVEDNVHVGLRPAKTPASAQGLACRREDARSISNRSPGDHATACCRD